MAVALMRAHQGSLRRQSVLTTALVEAVGDSGDPGGEEEDRSGGKEDGSGTMASPRSQKPLVEDPWFQLVMCREFMLHGFYQAAEASLMRLQKGAASVCDTAWGWTEVLIRVSRAEAFYGVSTDQVSHAAHHNLTMSS